MKNYSNQPYHDQLDRHQAIELLAKVNITAQKSFEIPTNVVVRRQSDDWKTDSSAEQGFLSILENHSFPEPTNLQFKISLNGEYTVADFAYIDGNPSKTVLIFIDGLSTEIHGNPEAQRKDRLKRAKLRMGGYNVVECSARGLGDRTYLEDFLQMLSLYLEKWRS